MNSKALITPGFLLAKGTLYTCFIYSKILGRTTPWILLPAHSPFPHALNEILDVWLADIFVLFVPLPPNYFSDIT